MPLTLANPYGLFALLGVPVLVAIHYLQRRTRTIPVATLFLIEVRRDQSRLGRRFERLISSWPMWLQLLMVGMLAVYLAQPRVPLAGSVQRLAVVVDDSASMRVFKVELKRGLAAVVKRCNRMARRTEILALPADPSRPRIYAGDSAAGLMEAIDGWQPVGGPVDPAAALRLARERVGNHGMVIYATDTPVDKLPADADLLAVGHPVENVGITGLTLSETDGRPVWRAVVTNRGVANHERTWHLEWDQGKRSADATLRIPAGGMEILSGAMPAGASRLRLVLSPDEFTLDDSYNFLAAEPKPIRFKQQLPEPLKWLTERLARSVPGLTEASPSTPPDLIFAAASDGRFPLVDGPAVLMSAAGTANAKTLPEPVVAAHYALVAGLSWESLAVQDVPMVPAISGDVVLLWCGQRPLVSLRPASASVSSAQQLVFHFNPTFSNMERLPAAAVLLLRYCEDVRLSIRGTSREQLEPHQAIANLLPGNLREKSTIETLDLTGKSLATRIISPNGLAGLRAPDDPCFLRVREGGTTLLDGAVAFADAREGDFRACASRDPQSDPVGDRSAGDLLTPWWPLVILLVLSALLVSWYFTGREARAIAEAQLI